MQRPPPGLSKHSPEADRVNPATFTGIHHELSKFKTGKSNFPENKLTSPVNRNEQETASIQHHHHDFGQISISSIPAINIQPKLENPLSPDSFEEEADHVAEVVTRDQHYSPTPQVPITVEKSSDPVHEDNLVEEPELMEEHKSNLQFGHKTISTTGDSVPSPVKNLLHRKDGTGFPLPATTKKNMEKSFGFDFSGVRIHHDETARKLNQSLQARAFTHGRDIYFNQEEWDPLNAGGTKLLAHELTHVVQQSPVVHVHNLNSTFPVQRKLSFGGFFGNLWRSIYTIFGDEPDYSAKDLTDYLAIISKGEIEGDYDSDNKARVVARQFKEGKRSITMFQKVWLIKEMLDGPTGDDDENAILDILKNSPGELTFILTNVKPAELREDFHGSELKVLDKMLKAWEKRTQSAKAADVSEVAGTYHDIPFIIGDGTPENTGITMGEFQDYILQQADWFTEDSLKKDDATRNKLWDVAVFMQEGDHVRQALANIKMKDIMTAKPPQMELLHVYVEGAKPNAMTIKIRSQRDDFTTVLELADTMKQLQSFIPGQSLRVVISESYLRTISVESLATELKKYFDHFSPTLESASEAFSLIELLKEKVEPYFPLKWWIHDLHIITKASRLKLLDNIREKKREKPVLLVLMSAVDHNGAFIAGSKLEEAILHSKNLALMLQGQETLKQFGEKVNYVADTYGQHADKKQKGRIAQVMIAGHGTSGSVQLAAKNIDPKIVGDDDHVDFKQERIAPASRKDESIDLIDTILKRLEPADAKWVFAGCLVGSHDLEFGDELKNTKKAAKVITKAIKANPNLRDIVEERMEKLKIKGNVQAANATTVFDSFVVDEAGIVTISTDKDPSLGAKKSDYVKTGAEPKGALRAVLETWADDKYGPKWVTDAMREYVEVTYKDDKEWWRTITRTAYKLALPASGNVDPAVVNDILKRVDTWFNAGWQHEIKINALDTQVKPAEVPILFDAMLQSDTSTYLQIVINQLWAKTDATKITDFMKALEDTWLKGKELMILLDLKFISPHYATILATPDPAFPSKSQLRLALTIAAEKGTAMPEEIKTLLKNAAGNTVTTSFPVALNVKDYLEGTSEIVILRHIGLAPGVEVKPEAPKEKPTEKEELFPVDLRPPANADLTGDKTNESLVTVKPVKFTLTTSAPVWSTPDVTSAVMTTLARGTVVRVAGTFKGMAVIDLNGTVAFVDLTLISKD